MVNLFSLLFNSTLFNKAWTQILRRFKSYLGCVRYLWWWESQAIFQAENRLKAFRWSTVLLKQFVIIIVKFITNNIYFRFQTKVWNFFWNEYCFNLKYITTVKWKDERVAIRSCFLWKPLPFIRNRTYYTNIYINML